MSRMVTDAIIKTYNLSYKTYLDAEAWVGDIIVLGAISIAKFYRVCKLSKVDLLVYVRL